MGKTSLTQRVKSATGKTPHSLINSLRLDKAASLLHDCPELSIAEISYMTGFCSPSHFIKAFKHAYGKTPTAFRKNSAGA